MIFFSKHNTNRDLFVIQNNEKIGQIKLHNPTDGLDDAVGDASRGSKPSQTRFLGLRISKDRFKLGWYFIFTVAIIMLSRAAWLQIIQGNKFQALAASNRFRTNIIAPPRGIILDRNGKELVKNVPSFTLTLRPLDLPLTEPERSNVIERIADLAGIQRTEIDLILTDSTNSLMNVIPIKRGINHEQAIRLAIETPKLPGFELQTSSIRGYSKTTPSLSHVLGYMGKINKTDYKTHKDLGYQRNDQIGQTGIERSAENILRGTPGELILEVDARGNELSIVSKTNSVAGQNIKLTIDLDLQEYIETKTKTLLNTLELTRASVVAIDPRDGAIRAMVSLPTFDSNDFADGIDSKTYSALAEDKNKPLFPRATSGEFAAGSTFKPFVTYAALAENIISPTTKILSTGGIRVGLWFFPDWRAGGHGLIDARQAIANSVNTYYYIIGGGYEDITGLGVARIRKYAERFGFNQLTGIDLPSESDGFIPSKQWKEEAKGERWYIGDTYNLSIGQGDLLVTPLQLAVATSTIANNGTRVKPYLLENQANTWPLENLDLEAIKVVQEGMRGTVTYGSARRLSLINPPIAGKTGTAQAPGTDLNNAWFISYGPYEDPNLVIVVLIEEGGEGSSTAAPLAGDIFEWWFKNRVE